MTRDEYADLADQEKFRCTGCDKIYSYDDGIHMVDSENLCDDCGKTHMVTCDICNKELPFVDEAGNENDQHSECWVAELLESFDESW